MVCVQQKRRKELRDKEVEQQRLEEERRIQAENKRREEQEARALQETENQFRIMQMKEKSRIDSERSAGRTVLNNITTVTIGSDERRPSSSSDISPSAPSVYEPSAPFDETPSPLPTVPPPPYSSVINADQRQYIPVIPDRNLKPMAASASIM